MTPSFDKDSTMACTQHTQETVKAITCCNKLLMGSAYYTFKINWPPNQYTTYNNSQAKQTPLTSSKIITTTERITTILFMQLSDSHFCFLFTMLYMMSMCPCGLFHAFFSLSITTHKSKQQMFLQSQYNLFCM